MTRSHAWMRVVVRSLSLVVVLGAASPSNAEPPSAGSPHIAAKVLDLLIVRPASLLQCIIGGVVTVTTFPLFIFSGDVEHILDVALRDPLEYTVERPLGEF